MVTFLKQKIPDKILNLGGFQKTFVLPVVFLPKIIGKNMEEHCPELLLQTDAHSCSAEALKPDVAYSIGF